MKRNILGVIPALVLSLLLLPAMAQAVATLDFGIIAPTPGTIEYDPSALDALVGTDIQVDEIVGLDSALNNGVVATCIDCVLNFATGALTGSTANTWDFGGGGTSSITIIGGIDFDGDGVLGAGDIAAGTTLLWGGFGAASVIDVSGTFSVAISSFGDNKNSDLLAFYGFTSELYDGAFNISFQVGGTQPTGGFKSSSVLSGDVVNVVAVPEPVSLLLMGSGMIGMALFRKKFKA